MIKMNLNHARVKKILVVLLTLLLILSIGYAYTPPSDIDGRNYYRIFNITNVSADDFFGNFIPTEDIDFLNQYGIYNVSFVNGTIIYMLGNITTESWFNGFYNWVVNSPYMTFNGSVLIINETAFNNSFVPYEGATDNVDLNAKNLSNVDDFSPDSIEGIIYVAQGDADDLETKWNNLEAGEHLIIPCGLYEIDQALYCKVPNVTYEGMGYCTYIKQADDSNLANKSKARDLGLIQCGIDENDTRYETYDITLKGFTLDFNQAGQSDAVYYGRSNEAKLNGIGIYIDGTDNIMIDQVEVIDAYGIAIWLYGTDANSNKADIKGIPTVQNSIVKCNNCGGQLIGLMVSGNLVYDVLFDNNDIDTNATNLQAIRGEEMIRGIITRNTVRNPGGNGIGVFEHSATPSILDHYTTVSFNNLIGQFQAAIQVGIKSNHVDVLFNHIIPDGSNKAVNGLDFYANNITSKDIKAIGNTIHASTRCIYFRNITNNANGVNGSEVTLNTLYDCATGVLMQSLSSNNWIHHNVIDSSVSTPYTDLGTSNIFHDNFGSTTETVRTFYNTLTVQSELTGLRVTHSGTNSYGLDIYSNTALTSTVNALVRFKLDDPSATKPTVQIESDSNTGAALDLLSDSGKAMTVQTGQKLCLDSTTCSIYINNTNIAGFAKIEGTIINQNGNNVLDDSDESNLNVNKSNFWDDLDTPTDIRGLNTSNIESMNWTKLKNYPTACPGSAAVTTIGDSNTCQDLWIDDSEENNLNVNSSIYSINATRANEWDGETSQSNLNVNSSDNWDSLGSINATVLENNDGILGVVKSWWDGLYCQLTGCTITGTMTISNIADSQALTITSNGPGVVINHNDTNSYAFSSVSTGTVSSTVNAQNRFDCRGVSSNKACLQVDSDSSTAEALSLTAATSMKAMTITTGSKICLDSTTCSIYLNSTELIGMTSLSSVIGAFSNITVSDTVKISDSANNKAVIIETGDKVCLNGEACTAYLEYNGTDINIVSP